MNSVCVFISNSKLNWCDAQQYCRQIGGELLTGSTALQALSDGILDSSHPSYLWIGGTDFALEQKTQKSGWRWTNGVSITQSLPWREYDVPGRNPEHDCLEINNKNFVLDYFCSHKQEFVCQPANITIPTVKYFVMTSEVQAFSATSDFANGACTKTFSTIRKTQCAAKCFQEEGICASFYFNPKQAQCRLVLYTDAAVDIGNVDDWLKFVFRK